MNKLYNYLTSNKVIRITLIVFFFSNLFFFTYSFLHNYSQSTTSLISYLKLYPFSQILSLFVLIGFIISLLINTDILNNRLGKILIITYFLPPIIGLQLNEIYVGEYYLFGISQNFYSILMFVLLIISFLSRHKLVFIISSVLIIMSIGYLIPLFSPSYYPEEYTPYVGEIPLKIVTSLVGFVTYLMVSIKLISNLVKSKFDGLGYLLLIGLPISIVFSSKLLLSSTHPDFDLSNTDSVFSEVSVGVFGILMGFYLILWVVRSIDESDISILKGNVHRGGKNLINIVKLNIISILLPLLNYILVVVFESYEISQFIGFIGLILSLFILYLLTTTSLSLINSVKSNSSDSVVVKTDKTFLNSEFKTLSILVSINLILFLLVQIFHLDIIRLSIPMGVVILITSIVMLFTLNNIGKKLVEV